MKREFSVTLDSTTYKIVVDGNSILVDGQPFVVGFEDEQVLVDGIPYDVKLEDGRAVVNGIPQELSVEGWEEEKTAPPGPSAVVASEGAVTAIMPGKIIRVLVAEGDQVAKDDIVCILEAMKMENELKAPKSGVIKKLYVQPGQDVETRSILAEIE